MIVKKANKINGEITVPGDKSISHRSIMIGSIASGDTFVSGFLQGADCLSSIDCFTKMGIDIENNGTEVVIHGKGMRGLTAPCEGLYVGNSGTTIRLMSGILAAANFDTVVSGDASIAKRPMKRIITPLSLMGADIISRDGYTPLQIHGKALQGITYNSPVASAQVKSGIILAGLYADGETKVIEPYKSRNHTELMLKDFGADISSDENSATIKPADKLLGRKVFVPGDISSATYFMVAAAITPNSCVTIKNVGINETRDGIIRVLSMMGADIKVETIDNDSSEPTADITVKTSTLSACEIGGELIPTLIDEIPAIAVMACFANGTTVIKDAKELKVKESNRIDTVVNNLVKMGADVVATEDGMIINGGKPLHGATIDSFKDHRIAMSFYVAALNAEGDTNINDADCVDISFPGFYALMNQIVNN